MTTLSDAEMRRDLEHWRDEHARWRTDIRNWQAEHQAALEDLRQLETVLERHSEAVGNHAAAIEDHEQLLVDQTRRVDEGHGTMSRKDATIRSHELLAARRAQHHDAHQRIRAHHLVVMAQLRLLAEAMVEAM
jgi:hypothetical protein